MTRRSKRELGRAIEELTDRVEHATQIESELTDTEREWFTEQVQQAREREPERFGELESKVAELEERLDSETIDAETRQAISEELETAQRRLLALAMEGEPAT